MSTSQRAAALLAARSANRTAAAAPVPTAAPVAAAAPKKKGPWVKKPGGDFDISIVPAGTPKEALRQRRMPGRGQGGQTVTVDGARTRGQQRGQGGVSVSRGRNQGHGSVSVRPGSASSGVQVQKKVTTESTTGVQAQVIPASPATRAQAQARAAVPAVSNAPFVDLTVLLAYSTRPQLVEKQQRLLSTQSVQPRAVFAHCNPSDKVEFPPAARALVDQIPNARPNVDIGAWARWGLVATVGTKYVCIIDDDCIPGPRWFELAEARLRAGNEHDVVAAAGAVYNSDAFNDLLLVGPEAPPVTEVEVDVGRGAWFMHTATARKILSEEPAWPMLSTGLHVASITQALGGAIMVLPYSPSDHAGWGMLDAPLAAGSVSERIDAEYAAGNLQQSSAEIRDAIYTSYREDGWTPICVGLAADSQELSAEDVAAATAPAEATA